MHERQTPKGQTNSASGTFNAQPSDQPRPHAQSGSSGAASGQTLEQLLTQVLSGSQEAPASTQSQQGSAHVHVRPDGQSQLSMSPEAQAQVQAQAQAQAQVHSQTQAQPKPQPQPQANVHQHVRPDAASGSQSAGSSSANPQASGVFGIPSGGQQASQQPTQTNSQGGGSGRAIGLPAIVVGILVFLFLFFSQGCAQTSSVPDSASDTDDSAATEETVSVSDLMENGEGSLEETPVMQRGNSLFELLFGFDPTAGYTTTYDSSQYTSAYEIDPALGQGNPNETWTVLMYLCGSDLESTATRQGGGQATNNLVELTKANLGQNVKFVVETGGAKRWQNDVISPKYLSRYTIEGGKMALQDRQPSASMAAESTFADFLKWGTANFPADHYMLVIWDHGGGSITGVCQDDIYPYDSKGGADSLTLPEMRDALKKSGAKFDVIGFDTCLMATLETAQILSPFAKCMVASEESEPGAGWDYTSWPNWLAAHPGTSPFDLGTVICQTYYNKCASYRQQGMATLSVIDLNKVGKVSKAFENASDDIALATVDPMSLRRLQQGAKSAESYGNSGFYSMNMVDLGDLMSKTSSVVGNDANAVVKAVGDAVVYEVHGRNRASASGLSVYFPLKITDRKDFTRYAEITDNTPYLQFLAVMFGVYDNYQWNKFENFVPLHGEPVAEKDVKIKYKQTVNKDGHVQLKITEGIDQVANVSFEMYVYLDQLGILCYLGSDNDMNGSYDLGTFVDNFQDDWLTIDGHYVSASLCEVGDGYNLYYIPILLNGEQTGLVIEYEYATNEYNVLCVWDEANQETGMAGKTGRLLEEGDKVQFLFPAENAKTGISDVIPLETMEWHEDAVVLYEGLGDGNFAFRYEITDVLGNKVNTELVFQRYKDGKVAK